ncbi:MAG: GNAT family N-acetyltransferase [candidate division Zixibacteria bacterium]
MLIFCRDKKRLREHFLKDRVLFAYHLGDLDDFFFDDCQCAVLNDSRGRVEECLLTYFGCDSPSVLAFGLSDRFVELTIELRNLLPDRFYCHYQRDLPRRLIADYEQCDLGRHQKMQLERFIPCQSENCSEYRIVRLDNSHTEDLRQLYALSYPDNYFVPRMLLTGKYMGAFDNDKLVGVTGVHVDSDEYKITVLGNITTHPEYRSKGMASILTSRLLSELTDEKKLICLNVSAENKAAIACYQRLGFVTVHNYREALFTRIV